MLIVTEINVQYFYYWHPLILDNNMYHTTYTLHIMYFTQYQLNTKLKIIIGQN